jgi:hypothetical protein
MSLVLHWRHLGPFVFFDDVLFNRVEPLFATEATEHIDVTAAKSDGVCVAAFVHHAFANDLILCGQVYSSIFLWRRATASDQNFNRA